MTKLQNIFLINSTQNGDIAIRNAKITDRKEMKTMKRKNNGTVLRVQSQAEPFQISEEYYIRLPYTMEYVKIKKPMRQKNSRRFQKLRELLGRI